MPSAAKKRSTKNKAPSETLGVRIARLRKQAGLTQTELAEQLGTTQNMVSEYERDGRRIHAEMIVRLAEALQVSADQLLALAPLKNGAGPLNLNLVRRLKKIEDLSTAEQKVLFKTIDTFLKGAER